MVLRQLSHKLTIPRIQTSRATPSSEGFMQNYHIFHQTGEIIKWGCAISIFVGYSLICSELNYWISAFGPCRENGKSVEYPIALLKSAAVTGRQDSHLRTGLHDIRLPTWRSEWVSWSRFDSGLHHHSKEVSCHCVSAELEMPKKCKTIRTLNKPSQGSRRLCNCILPGAQNGGYLDMTGSDWAWKYDMAKSK